MRYLPSPQQLRGMDTDELRRHFLVEELFRPGRIVLTPIDLDRVILGGAVPDGAPLVLDAPEALGAEYFTERREIGALNIGGPGAVTVNGFRHEVANRDVLYVGRGTREVSFESTSPDAPARFYLVSYPAHAAHPTRLVTRAEAEMSELGAQETANRRRLYKYVHPDGAQSAQLVMGVTELMEGSVWNTMPPHTHARRTEAYLYFDLPADAAVFHFLGEPEATRSMVVRDSQVALSPAWSIHSGCGTRSYSFCWAMGGENQAFADMQAVETTALR